MLKIILNNIDKKVIEMARDVSILDLDYCAHHFHTIYAVFCGIINFSMTNLVKLKKFLSKSLMTENLKFLSMLILSALLGVFIFFSNLSTYAQSTTESKTRNIAKNTAVDASLKSNKSFKSGKNILKKISIEGNRKYNSSYYNDFITVKPGVEFSVDVQNQIVKDIVATGYVEDIRNVNFDERTGTLAVEVEERPFILDVTFKNAKELKDDIIKDNIKSVKKEVFSDKNLRSDVEFIKTFYRSQGFLRVQVTPELREFDDGRAVEIVFNVDRGAKAKIDKIVFIGNRVFSDGTLKDNIFSRENRFYRFGRAIYYDPGLLDYDSYMLTQFYMSKGYYDFNIVSARGIYNKENNTFDIVYQVEENSPYKIASLEIEDNVGKIDRKILEEAVSDIKKGSVFNIKQIQAKIDKLNSIFEDRGITFITINPRISKEEQEEAEENEKKKEKDNLVNVVLQIDRVEKKYIGRIRIKNNSRTRDYVIREQLNIEEGSVYNEFAIKRSLQKVEALGFFEKVTYEETEGTFTNQRDITIIVEEGSTGSFNLSFGYSSMDGWNIGINFLQRNLFGRAIYQSIDIGIYQNTQRLGFNLVKPKIFGTEITGGMGLFAQNNDVTSSRYQSGNMDFDNYMLGGNLSLTFFPFDFFQNRIEYHVHYKKYKKLDLSKAGLPLKIRYDFIAKDPRITSEISFDFSYDRRNNYYSPSSGYFLNLDLSLAGLGGDAEYFKSIAHAMLYLPIYRDRVVFKMEGKTGYVTSLRKSHPLFPDDGFYLGGYNFRGFQAAGVGPRPKFIMGDGYGTGLGGKFMYTLNAELKVSIFGPVAILRSAGLIFFANAGSTTGMEENDKINTLGLARIVDSGSLRAACGISIFIYTTAFGNISFDFSKTLKKESYDRDENFTFSVGKTF